MSARSYRVKVPPSTGMLRGMIAAGSMNLHRAIYELIDNSLDKKATEIRIDRTKDEIIVDDNGNGCADLMEMVRLGSVVEYEKGSIGRYGVGFKDAVVWLGNRVLVDSLTKKNQRRSINADWGNMISLNDWDFGLVDECVRKTHGVTIIISELRPRRTKGWNTLSNHLSGMFSAALDAGIKIIVNGQELQSKPHPILTDAVTLEGISDGLGWRFTAGIMADPKSALSGWEIRYGVKTVANGYVKEGFGQYNSQGFYGRFQMMDMEGERKWQLTRNKEDSEDLADVLNGFQVQDAIKPILEKLKTLHRSVNIKLNHEKVDTTLTKLLQHIKVAITKPEPKDPGDSKKPRPEPDPNQEIIKREPRKYNPDPLSQTKRKINAAQTLQVLDHHEPEQRGVGFVVCSSKGSNIIVYIDAETEQGKALWDNEVVLTNVAIFYFALYLGVRVDILQQLMFQIGEESMSDEMRVSKAHLFLLEAIGEVSRLEDKSEAA